MCILFLDHFHGAPTRRASDELAFAHRQHGYNVLIIAQWTVAVDSEANIAWARQTYTALEPHMNEGVYSNYMGDDETATRVQRAYGQNFERLRALKARYDPENRFHLNQNIPPSS